MFKVLLIVFFFGYLLYMAWGLLFRMLGYTQQKQRYQESKSRKPKDGNVNIDYDPNQDRSAKNKSKMDFRGGDYIDYEEVK